MNKQEKIITVDEKIDKIEKLLKEGGSENIDKAWKLLQELKYQKLDLLQNKKVIKARLFISAEKNRVIEENIEIFYNIVNGKNIINAAGVLSVLAENQEFFSVGQTERFIPMKEKFLLNCRLKNMVVKE